MRSSSDISVLLIVSVPVTSIKFFTSFQYQFRFQFGEHNQTTKMGKLQPLVVSNFPKILCNTK